LFNLILIRISPRTPVTKNDPLGALNVSEIISIEEVNRHPSEEQREELNMYSDKPVLFKGQRSATFDESVQLNKSIHRSETMPGTSVTSSLANIGSSLKFNFG